jgi:hypothetical protein
MGRVETTKTSHFVQAVRNRNKLKPHRPPKEKRKNLNGLLVANNSGTIYQRKFFETKTATALIIRTEEVPPLPCLQRPGLCADVELTLCPPTAADD